MALDQVPALFEVTVLLLRVDRATKGRSSYNPRKKEPQWPKPQAETACLVFWKPSI